MEESTSLAAVSEDATRDAEEEVTDDDDEADWKEEECDDVDNEGDIEDDTGRCENCCNCSVASPSNSQPISSQIGVRSDRRANCWAISNLDS
jgi:hypothetical protein